MKNWRNILSVVEILIMLTCIIILITYFASKKENYEDNNQDNLKELNGVIKEDYALEYLNKYVDELLFSGYINDNSNRYIEKEYSFITPNIFSELTNNDKIYLSLSYLTNAKMPLTKDNVERKYNEYFNNKDVEHSDVNGCATYSYDKEKEAYNLITNCLVKSSDKLMVYKKRYERQDKNGIATLYIGIKSDLGIFTNLEKTKIFATDSIENFTINEDNYTEFSKYIINFKEKDDALYYFFSIEPAN